jgi:uncharacterized SAM-binding protein YcdF (DUF218 family)
LLTAALVLLLVSGWLPLPNLILRQLERQYTEFAPQADLRAYTGVVVLGGATESGAVAQSHVQPGLNGAAERLTAPIALLRRNSQLRMVFTGGQSALWPQGPTEAERARLFFESMGVPPNSVIYESASRNTHENALLTAQIAGLDITQPWLLLTSAAHMPRAMATFAKAGWNVTAYPVDFQTADDMEWAQYSMSGGAEAWEMALHEVLGLLAYRIKGWL